MKSLTSIIGIVLIVFGIVAIGYQGFTYSQKETVAEIGNVQVTATQEKKINLPPLVGGISLIAGIILVVMNRSK